MDFVVSNWHLFAALAVVLALLAWSHNADALGGFKNVAAADAVALINRGNARIIDLRPAEEFRAGHVVNAVNLPYTEAQTQIELIVDAKDRPLLLICGPGQRPALISRRARAAGVAVVYNLQGGMRAWQDANLPVTRAQEAA